MKKISTVNNVNKFVGGLLKKKLRNNFNDPPLMTKRNLSVLKAFFRACAI